MILEELAEVAPFGVLADHADGFAREANPQDPDQVRVAQARQDPGLVLKVGSEIW